MSGNSTSQGASGFNTPVLPGYTVRWDEAAGEWVATSDTYGTVLRGRDQRALEAARGAVVTQLADEMYQIIRAAPLFGYSPQPQP